MNTADFFSALTLIEKERAIPVDYLAEKVKTAIIVAVKRDYGGNEIVFCDIDVSSQTFRVFVRKTVVDEIENHYTDILLEEAQKLDKNVSIGEFVDIDVNIDDFGRIVAQTAKHVIRAGIREAENSKILAEFEDKKHQLLSAKVTRVDPRNNAVTVEIGKNEAVLPRGEQLPDELIREGDYVKIYVVDAKETEKGPKIYISRTHAGLVKCLFELEVPEVAEGIIEVKSIAREAGSRTKMAVWSSDENIDPIGSCIGARGERVNKIVEELDGEKIDIVRWHEDPKAFISEALSPANVIEVEIEEPKPVELDEDGNEIMEQRVCHVTVPDHQLSLAIGNRGQNVRLAAKLVGYKIDIKPESGFLETSDAD